MLLGRHRSWPDKEEKRRQKGAIRPKKVVDAFWMGNAMPNATIPSRPKYVPFELVSTARAHLIVAESPEVLSDHSIFTTEEAPLEFWAVVRDCRASVEETIINGIDTSHFRSTSHLMDRLSYRLASETIGLHLYVIGTEPFMWDVIKLAKQLGMNSDEYHLTHHGSQKRRVYCVHCKALTEGITTNIAVCSGCGARLFVRDHFSKRLAAFMGVQVDAEVAGEIPAVEEVYS